MLFFTIIGIVGLLFLLAAFGLLEFGVISDGLFYLAFNAAGSLSLIVYALGTGAYIFIALNAVWFVVAVLKMGVLLRKRTIPIQTARRQRKRRV